MFQKIRRLQVASRSLSRLRINFNILTKMQLVNTSHLVTSFHQLKKQTSTNKNYTRMSRDQLKTQNFNIRFMKFFLLILSKVKFYQKLKTLNDCNQNFPVDLYYLRNFNNYTHKKNSRFNVCHLQLCSFRSVCWTLLFGWV